MNTDLLTNLPPSRPPALEAARIRLCRLNQLYPETLAKLKAAFPAWPPENPPAELRELECQIRDQEREVRRLEEIATK